jgi:fructokinase
MRGDEAMIGAVEAGGTKFVLAVASSGGDIIARERIDTRAPEQTFAEMVEWFRAQEAKVGTIAAFGIASFGPVDIDPASPRYGTIGPTPKPRWEGARYHDALTEFAVPVAVDTDVNGAALAEWIAAGREGTLAYTTVGTGIGSGIVTRGRPLAGATHFEAGHVRVPHDRAADPFAGSCAFHGDCIEGLASGSAIRARWNCDMSHATADRIELIAGYLGDFGAMLILSHMPDRMVFGGGVMKTPGLIEALRRCVRASLAGYVPLWAGDLEDRIVTPVLGDDAGITGAIAIGRQALNRPDSGPRAG